jgi:plasmid stabilization system protein ParE
LKVRWTRPALNDLLEAQTYIAQHNPQAAQTVAQRLWDSAQQLADHPQIGRRGHTHGTRDGWWRMAIRIGHRLKYLSGPAPKTYAYAPTAISQINPTWVL